MFPQLKIDPTEEGAQEVYKTWCKSFDDLIVKNGSKTKNVIKDNFMVLKKCITPYIWAYINDCKNYKEAREMLDGCYLKQSEQAYIERLLQRRQQLPGEYLDIFAECLDSLAVKCANIRN